MQETPEDFKAFWERASADAAERRACVAEIIAAGGAKTGVGPLGTIGEPHRHAP